MTNLSEMAKSLRNQQLDGIILLKPMFSCQGLLGEFVDLYLQCELLARKLIQYYKKDKDLSYSENDFNIADLKRALRHFRIFFSFDDIQILFTGGKGKRNNKSARQLRNGFFHSLSAADKKEILEKGYFLCTVMNRFVMVRLT